MEFKIKNRDEVFRIKHMNAIEVFALRNMIGGKNMEDSIAFYEAVLERIEVQVGNTWLPVKEKGMNVYMPTYVEDNVQDVENLVYEFVHNYLYPLFRKSSESKQ